MGGDEIVQQELTLRLLGPVEIRQTDGWHRPQRPKQRLVISVLALQAGRLVSLDQLIHALWDGTPPRTARNSIQVMITHLRTLLSSLDITLTRLGPGYRLDVDPSTVDVYRFQRKVEQGRSAGRGRAAIKDFDQALLLWRGPALADTADTAAARQLRYELDNQRLSALEARSAALLRFGRPHEATLELTSLLAEHPLREPVAAMLMAAQYLCGEAAEALRVFREIRERLVEELGIEPGPELQRLHQRILARELALPTDDRLTLFELIGSWHRPGIRIR